MEIFVKRLDFPEREIEVQENADLDEVRMRILGILPEKALSVGQIQLIFDDKEINHGCLAEHGVMRRSTLTIVVKKKEFIQIPICNGNEKSFLNVEPCESIKNVQKMIAEREDCSVDQVALHFGTTELSGGRLYHFNGLVNGSECSEIQLTVTKDIEITIKDMKGTTNKLKVSSDLGIEAFKKMVHEVTKVIPKQQKLTYKGNKLSSGVLSDYGIGKGSTVNLQWNENLRGG